MPARRHLAALALLALALPACAGPAWQGVYDGVLGNARVIVALGPGYSRYAYLAKANDLGLIATEAGGGLQIAETIAPGIGADDIKANGKLVTGHWTLKQQGEKLTGRWTDAAGGRARAISLTRVSRKADSGEDAPGGNPAGAYGARWLAAAAPFAQQGGEATSGPLAYTLLRDPHYGNTVPHLTRAAPGVRLEAVNKQLENLLGALVLRDRNCMQDLRSSTALSDPASLAEIERPPRKAVAASQESIKPVFATAGLLVLLETRSQFCGGAHSANTVSAFTFDLQSPRQITGLGEGSDDLAPSALGAAFDFADTGKRTRFDSLWVERFRAAVAREAKVHGADEVATACGADLGGQLEQGGAGIDRIVYPLKEGLAIRATGFGHATSICASDYAANPLVLPWAEVKPFLKAGQKLLPGG